MNLLERIIAAKREEIKSYGTVETGVAGGIPPKPGLADRLRESKGVIAEIKKASPSKGDIRLEVDVVKQARIYEEAGAAAISVLTDNTFFKGSIKDLRKVAELVGIPVLCKDFIVDEIQIDRAKEAGASVILLIVAALGQDELKRLYSYAQSEELEVLVEVHNVEELEIALGLGAELIGVNNRDLKTFEVALERTAEIAGYFPPDSNSLLISESGISLESDAHYAFSQGAAGILVGEALMRAKDAGRWIKDVTSQELAK
ncbi:indole-3-glycerol phosphate synthase TrpC [Planococcus beigongshangi]|uniref:indole-3-glycerol phosphate synthase TrpC n=1 Tax=Planococcus beigongshangi TaxID=2782536 RepID=UPI00193C28F9|nr:indole-3-glycerol phosphate synthase TrpC [Planococcus beigongshangi]